MVYGADMNAKKIKENEAEAAFLRERLEREQRPPRDKGTAR